ncbi:MAG: Dabb family protein [Phycisphaerales bacterium JB040]
MKHPLLASLAGVPCLFLLVACSSHATHAGPGDDGHAAARGAHPAPPARIGHVVLLSLNDPADAPELIESSREVLGPIPGITTLGVGTHLETGRDALISDYDVALYIGFQTEADYSAYLVHPDHVAYVDAWRPRLTSIRIIDILEAD